MKLEQFFFEYYVPHKPSTSPKTIRLYKNSMRKFGQWLGAIPKLSDLNDSNVGQFLVALLESGDLPGTVNKERAHLLAIWRFANVKGRIKFGPTVQKVIEPEQIPKALSVNEMRQLKFAFPLLQGKTAGIPNCDFLEACFSIQFATAARVGAVMQLRFDDVVGDVITFRSETRKGRRKPIVKAVPKFVLEAIDRIRFPRRERIFPIKKTNETKVQTLYSRLFERAGVARPKGKSSHLLRSTHATMVFLAGGDPTASLGHGSRETTFKSYIDPRHKPDRSCDLLPDIHQ